MRNRNFALAVALAVVAVSPALPKRSRRPLHPRADPT